MKNGKSHIFLERQNLCLSSYKNRKLKIKLWWVGACERKKKGVFCNAYFVWRKFFNICVLSQCIVNSCDNATWFTFASFYSCIHFQTTRRVTDLATGYIPSLR